MIKKKIVKLVLKKKHILIDDDTAVSFSNVEYLGPSTGGISAEIYGSNIGGHLSMGEGTKIWGSIIAGNVNLERFATISGPSTWVRGFFDGIRIGAFSSIAMNCVLLDYNHKFNTASQFNINSRFFNCEYKSDLQSTGKIDICEDVWIGANSVVTGGVTIGRGAIVGAGSIVTHDIPAYTIFAGNPAKFIRMRFDDNTIAKLEESEWWTWPLDKIKANHEFFELERNMI